MLVKIAAVHYIGYEKPGLLGAYVRTSSGG